MREILPSSDRWQQCAKLQAYSLDCTTTLNDRCAREACSFDGKLATIRYSLSVRLFVHWCDYVAAGRDWRVAAGER